MKRINGEWLIEAKECLKQFHEGKTSERALIIDLNRINRGVKRQIGANKNNSIWFRFFKNDTGATDIRNIERLLFHDTQGNKEYFMESVLIAVKKDSLEMYFS